MSLLQDLRYAARGLLKAPSFALTAVLILALGIGATTSVFSVVRTVLLKPLPYRAPERLALVLEQIGDTARETSMSPSSFVDYREQRRAFEDLGAFRETQFELSAPGQPARVDAARVTANLFPMLGLNPVKGRVFTAEEDQVGVRRALISFALWQARFGGADDIVGQSVDLDRLPYEIVGVMAQGLAFPPRGPRWNNHPADVWVPAAFTREELEWRGSFSNFGVLGYLTPGESFATAEQDARRIAAEIQTAHYPASMRLSARVIPFQDEVARGVRQPLWVLMGAVLLVLLVACAVLANLLLSRAADRRAEVAVRAALGAGRWRLARLPLAETLLLALAGASLGIVAAGWGTSALLALAPSELPRAGEVGLDPSILAFALALSLAAAALFGMAPALQTMRSGLMDSLRQRRNAGGGMRAAFVVSTVALSVVLLTGGGLLLRSMVNLLNADVGIEPEHILTMQAPLPRENYPERADVDGFYKRLVLELESLPGVESVGMSNDLPLELAETRGFTFENQRTALGERASGVAHSFVLGSYFQAAGIDLLQGRWFDLSDLAPARRSILISSKTARNFWPGENPLGKRLKNAPPETDAPWYTVVGVVADVKEGRLDADAGYHTYVPWEALSDGHFRVGSQTRAMNLAIRTTGDSAGVAAGVLAKVRQLDPGIAVAKVETMEQKVVASVAPERFNTLLLGVFAAASLLLAAVGIYGVLAYSVSKRIREIGLRMALGARAGNLRAMVLEQGLAMVGRGVALGLIGAALLARVLESLLFGVRPWDPLTYCAAPVVLSAAALLACWLPARRATRVEPMEALRHE